MKISIITITYNSEKTLKDTIKSVIKQNYDDLEYIIIDGGSKDGTLKIAKQYKKYISVIVSEPDNGISDAFNKGISHATGELIGIINSDDMLADGALNTIASEIHKDTDIIYGDIYRCDPDGKNMRLAKANDNVAVLKHGFSCMYHPATFIRKSAYEKYGVYELLRYCMDRELLLRMYTSGAKFQRVDKPLAIFRVGGESCKCYYKTAFESMNVSIKYGFPKSLAFCKTIYNICNMYAISAAKKILRRR